MNSRKLQEHLARVGRKRDVTATARQAAYVEALARDGHEAATARKLQQALEELEALYGTGVMPRPSSLSR